LEGGKSGQVTYETSEEYKNTGVEWGHMARFEYLAQYRHWPAGDARDVLPCFLSKFTVFLFQKKKKLPTGVLERLAKVL